MANTIRVTIILAAAAGIAIAGPYNEAGISGYTGPNHRPTSPVAADRMVNPIFRSWASGTAAYSPAPGVDMEWSDPNYSFGPATGDIGDIVSLGDLNQQQINAHVPPGSITLVFDAPIVNGKGYDLAVYENGFVSGYNTDGSSISGQMFAELAYVEVSTDGIHFARFPSVSLTPRPQTPTWAYLTTDVTNLYNLAGKHPNAGNVCTGTPFDLDDLANDPNVIAGYIDLNAINYVRIVDIPGSGDFLDGATSFVSPGSYPNWTTYPARHGIYDCWVTYGSGGFDLEAVGVLREQQYSADINLDGTVDMADFAIFAQSWQSHFGQSSFLARSDLALPHDHAVDYRDFAAFMSQWLRTESWRQP